MNCFKWPLMIYYLILTYFIVNVKKCVSYVENLPFIIFFHIFFQENFILLLISLLFCYIDTSLSLLPSHVTYLIRHESIMN